MAKKLKSVLTDDLDHCMFTGTAPVERHHVYGGSSRKSSEKYGFIAPLRPDLHPNGVFAGKDAKLVDAELKQRCQRYFEEHNGTRKEFISIFGRSYL